MLAYIKQDGMGWDGRARGARKGAFFDFCFTGTTCPPSSFGSVSAQRPWQVCECNVKFKDSLLNCLFFMHLLLFSRYLLEIRAMKNLVSTQFKGDGPVSAISLSLSTSILRCLLYPEEDHTNSEYTSKIPGMRHLSTGCLHLFLCWVEKNES